MSSKAIQRAIDDVFRAGGGTVNVPPGIFLTGRIELKSGVTLNLEAGCTLLGSKSINDYDTTPGIAGNSRHLISAMNAEDVVLSGPGRIDGQGSAFWEPSGNAALSQDRSRADVASHDLAVRKGGRPSPMLEFVNCTRLKIQDVQIENAPGWTLRIVNCDNVDIHGIDIKNPVNGPNTDGIDITGCKVTVSNSPLPRA